MIFWALGTLGDVALLFWAAWTLQSRFSDLARRIEHERQISMLTVNALGVMDQTLRVVERRLAAMEEKRL